MGERTPYFDIGKHAPTTSSKIEDEMGTDMKLSSLTDVEEGRAGAPFDLMIGGGGDTGSISGQDMLAQQASFASLKDWESFRASKLTQKDISHIESESKQAFESPDVVESVQTATVAESDRSQDDEIKVTVEYTIDGDNYASEFYIGTKEF